MDKLSESLKFMMKNSTSARFPRICHANYLSHMQIRSRPRVWTRVIGPVVLFLYMIFPSNGAIMAPHFRSLNNLYSFSCSTKQTRTLDFPYWFSFYPIPVCNVDWFTEVHDGPVTKMLRSPHCDQFLITLGGYSWALWSEMNPLARLK